MDNNISYGVNKIKNGYILIFFALTFNFKYGSADFLPDFIGYILILNGINILAKHRKSIMLLELPGIFMAVSTFTSAFFGLFFPGFQEYYYSYIWEIIKACVYVYFHFGIITELSFLCKEYEVNSQGIEAARNFLVVFNTVMIIIKRYLPVTGSMDFITTVVVISGFTASLIALFFYITMINSVAKISKEFKEKEKKPIPLE